MNYISHYFIVKNNSPYYTIGNLLPDIFPKFSYTRNKKLKKIDSDSLLPHEKMMWNGIENHYKVDAIFHVLPSFHQYTHAISDMLNKDERLSHIKRKFIVAHVLYELILDHMILDRESDIIEDIYKDIDTIEQQEVKDFLHKILKDKSLEQRYIDAYVRYNERRFLSFYTEEINLIKALHRVTGTIGSWEYNEDIEKHFLNIIQKMKETINFDKIFNTFITENS